MEGISDDIGVVKEVLGDEAVVSIKGQVLLASHVVGMIVRQLVRSCKSLSWPCRWPLGDGPCLIVVKGSRV
jgi:hypothetical protein